MFYVKRGTSISIKTSVPAATMYHLLWYSTVTPVFTSVNLTEPHGLSPFHQMDTPFLNLPLVQAKIPQVRLSVGSPWIIANTRLRIAFNNHCN